MMLTDEIQQLLASRAFRAEFEVSPTGLRIFLQDCDTGDVGLLAIEAEMLVLPDEAKLVYSYQDISAELGSPPAECLISDLKTNVAPAYEKGEVPFLFN